VVSAPSAPAESSGSAVARCEAAPSLAGTGDSVAMATVAPLVAAAGLGCRPPGDAFGAYFLLDLSRAPAPMPVQLLIDAPVSVEAALARGPCGDLRIGDCATSLYVDQRSRLISATLAPDRYVLIVNTATDGAAVHVSASVGELSCLAPPAHDSCAAAQPLDTSAAVQSLSGTLACARPDRELRCGALAAPDVFYALDLSDREGETLLDVDVVASRDDFVTAALFLPAQEGCGEPWMCGEQFSARLSPGRYYVGVSQGTGGSGLFHGLPDAAGAAPFALRVGLSQRGCADTPNDTWQTAVDLDPTLELQRVKGNTACGTSQWDGSCFEDRGAPELFYRLDLRGAPGPQRFEVRNLLSADTVNYVLLADAAGGSPQLASCEPLSSDFSSYHLAPRLYYLVVDGRVRNAARFELELQRSALPASSSCVTDDLLKCMADSEPACAGSVASADCLASSTECGLEPRTFEAFCAGAPGCCTGTGDETGCLDAWETNVGCH